MTEMPTMQETFDHLVGIPASLDVLYHEYDKVLEKHIETMKTEGKTDAYYDDVKALAEKFGLEFAHPKYAMGLKAVSTQPTVH